MKKMFIVFLSILFVSAAVAEDRCFLVGNTYDVVVDEVKIAELSGFKCTFGPGCSSNFDYWWGDFDSGPLWHTEFPFTCDEDGSAVIAGLPCMQTPEGALRILTVDTSGYWCVLFGGKIWCVPGDAEPMTFECPVDRRVR